jgi:elongation factor 1-beta
MGAVIIDDLIQTDSILERIECIGLTEQEAAKKVASRNAESDEEEEYDEDAEELGLVQSAEIVSFQKI